MIFWREVQYKMQPLTLIKMTLSVPRCRMAKNMVCPCSAFSPADPKIMSEDTYKMLKYQQLIGTVNHVIKCTNEATRLVKYLGTYDIQADNVSDQNSQ